MSQIHSFRAGLCIGGGLRLRRGLPIFLTLAIVLLVPPLIRSAVAADEIEWAPSFELALEQAQAEKKIVMVDFFTHWCHWCKVLDEKTYSDAKVIEASRDMVNVKVNAGTYVDIAREYRVNAFPTIVFLKPDGSVRTTVRGFKPPDRFLGLMNNARSVGGQLFAMKNQLQDRPDEPRLLQQYIELLAIDGRWREAAESSERLRGMIGSDDPERTAGLSLDVLGYRLRAGDDVSEEIEDWWKSNRNHPRALEARFRLAIAQEKAGKRDDAIAGFRAVHETGGKSWFAEAAKARL